MNANALDQYLELFDSQREVIDAHSAAPLNAVRDEAARSLRDRALPPLGSEHYEHTDLNAILAPDYGLNIADVPVEVDPALTFKCDVPHLSTSLFVTVNDRCRGTDGTELPEGVLAGSLREIAKSHPEVVEKAYARIADADNPLVALSTMLAQDGFMLYVPAGVRIERPIQLVNILAFLSPMMAVRRVLVVLEEDSEAKLLVCDHTQVADVPFLSLQTVEILAGRRARFDYYDLEESSAQTSRLSQIYLRQEEGSDVMIDGITLFNGTTRNEYHTVFRGADARLHLYGMAIEDADRRVDTFSRVSHEATGCHTSELFKYVADDRANAAFCGSIYVAPGASGTEAYQSSRNVISSDEARIFSKPQLIIHNDDVKCSHGTTIGRLDEMQMFYMETRGLSQATARRMLKQAFMADVIEGVRLPALKERLYSLVERRFMGESSACAGCRAASCNNLNRK